MQEQWKVRRVHVQMPQRTASGRVALPRRPRATHILIAILRLIENVGVFNFAHFGKNLAGAFAAFQSLATLLNRPPASEQHTEKTVNSPLTQGGCRQIVLWPALGKSATFASGARSQSASSRN